MQVQLLHAQGSPVSNSSLVLSDLHIVGSSLVGGNKKLRSCRGLTLPSFARRLQPLELASGTCNYGCHTVVRAASDQSGPINEAASDQSGPINEAASDQSGPINEAASPAAVPAKDSNKLLNALQNANKLIPYVVVGSTLTALTYPPSFSWFANSYYAPALGFLMFAVGINLNYSDFVNAFKRPSVLAIGYMGQFVVKPLLGVLFASIAVSYLHLPDAIGTGIVLVSCVSGAQLSNYATFLVDRSMAPLSIVMTALSTVTAVFVIPALTHVLLGQRLPVDARSMMFDIMQIVIAPIAAGLALKQFAPAVTGMIKPLLPILSVMVTSLCMGSPLARNIDAVKSPFGLELLLPIIGFHTAAFLIGHKLSGLVFRSEPDRKGLQRTISLETGMQSSLLGLALANKYFADPLVGLPSALSTVLMSLMGFGLVMYWNAKKERKNRMSKMLH